MDINKIYIEKSNLILRPLKISDIDRLYEIANNPKLAKMSGFKAPSTLQEAKDLLDKMLKAKDKLAIIYKGIFLGLIELADPSLMIKIFLKDRFDKDKSRILGYFIDEKYWNKGIMTLALEILFEYLKSHTSIETIISSHYLDNHRSMAILVKFDFQPIKSIEIQDAYGDYRELLIYSKDLIK